MMPGMSRATTTPNLAGLNLNAYLRPRFTSLTSAYTVNSGSSGSSGPMNTNAPLRGTGLARAKTSATGKRPRFDDGAPSRSQSLSVQTPARAIKDANGPAGVVERTRREGVRFNSFQSFDALPTVGGAAKANNLIVNGGNRGHHRERSWGPGGLNLNLTGGGGGGGPKSAGAAFAFPRFLGRGSEEAVSDEEEASDEVAAGLEEEEAEWGLGQHMRLFEVSAKDASGMLAYSLDTICKRLIFWQELNHYSMRSSVLLSSDEKSSTLREGFENAIASCSMRIMDLFSKRTRPKKRKIRGHGPVAEPSLARNEPFLQHYTIQPDRHSAYC